MGAVSDRHAPRLAGATCRRGAGHPPPYRWPRARFQHIAVSFSRIRDTFRRRRCAFTRPWVPMYQVRECGLSILLTFRNRPIAAGAQWFIGSAHGHYPGATNISGLIHIAISPRTLATAAAVARRPVTVYPVFRPARAFCPRCGVWHGRSVLILARNYLAIGRSHADPRACAHSRSRI